MSTLHRERLYCPVGRTKHANMCGQQHGDAHLHDSCVPLVTLATLDNSSEPRMRIQRAFLERKARNAHHACTSICIYFGQGAHPSECILSVHQWDGMSTFHGSLDGV